MRFVNQEGEGVDVEICETLLLMHRMAPEALPHSDLTGTTQGGHLRCVSRNSYDVFRFVRWAASILPERRCTPTSDSRKRLLVEARTMVLALSIWRCTCVSKWPPLADLHLAGLQTLAGGRSTARPACLGEPRTATNVGGLPTCICRGKASW